MYNYNSYCPVEEYFRETECQHRWDWVDAVIESLEQVCICDGSGLVQTDHDTYRICEKCAGPNEEI
jgi:hypothetical protein